VTYIIKAGDTLRNIAARYLGDANKWQEIWTTNKAHLRSKDPGMIYVGESIDIPTKSTKNTSSAAPPPIDDDEIALLVGGVLYSGWTEVSVTRSLEAASGSFSVTLTERWPGQTTQWPIFVGSAVQVYIGQDLVISGWVDDVDVNLTASDHSISVSGRDKTADIIDCSAVNRPGEWHGKKVEAIAQELCNPFGVTVRADVSTGAALDTFTLQPGEKVFEAIERAIKKKGLMLTSDTNGALIFTHSGSTRYSSKLKEGENLIEVSGKFSGRDRYSKYIVEAQSDGYGESQKQIQSTVDDKGVERYRPLSIMAEDQETAADAKRRAKWEASVRAARASVFTATVQGWRLGNEGIWKTNRIIAIEAPSARASGDVLIESINFLRGAAGTTTALTLKRPDAFKEFESATVTSTKDFGWAMQ
jgi:prophage tail gpP-like protein